MTNDPKPFDPLTDDVPIPEMGGFEQSVLVNRRGQEAVERDLLHSQVVTLTLACNRQAEQIAALKARLAELTPQETASDPAAPAIPDPVCTNPAEHPEPAAEPIPLPRRVGYVSPYGGA